jgi:hypothetical protein
MRLHGVTLVCADCAHPALGARAIAKSLEQCEFERAVLFTDAHAQVPAGVELVTIAPIASSLDYSRFMLKELVRHVDTEFVQVVQWDGYVVRGAAWTDDYRRFDYIGARWWFRPEGRDVGNGGFSLRSRKLLEALQDERVAVSDPEDDVICLQHRDRLEARGIRFADSATARQYAFEGEAPTGRELGFHRVFNLPYFNGREELAALMGALPDRELVSPAGVTMVGNLAALGRKGEAITYARRICRDRNGFHRALPEEFRSRLFRTVSTLAGGDESCPFRRCCGVSTAWPVTP